MNFFENAPSVAGDGHGYQPSPLVEGGIPTNRFGRSSEVLMLWFDTQNTAGKTVFFRHNTQKQNSPNENFTDKFQLEYCNCPVFQLGESDNTNWNGWNNCPKCKTKHSKSCRGYLRKRIKRRVNRTKAQQILYITLRYTIVVFIATELLFSQLVMCLLLLLLLLLLIDTTSPDTSRGDPETNQA